MRKGGLAGLLKEDERYVEVESLRGSEGGKMRLVWYLRRVVARVAVVRR